LWKLRNSLDDKEFTKLYNDFLYAATTTCKTILAEYHIVEDKFIKSLPCSVQNEILDATQNLGVKVRLI